MNFVWNHDNIQVGSITTNRWEGSQMWTSGFATHHTKYTSLLQWEANATPHGYYIVITKPGGKIGEFQGSTFNLPLEIAAAIRRLC